MNTAIYINPACYTPDFRQVVLRRPSRRTPLRYYNSPIDRPTAIRAGARATDNPSAIRRRIRRIGVKPAAIRHAEANAKAQQMLAHE
jgi:hypothetical protein